MNTWSVEKMQAFYTYLNEYFELSVNPEIEIGEKNRFPVQWNDGKILFIPTFFNDEDIDDDVRTNLLLIMYSGFYHTKYNDKSTRAGMRNVDTPVTDESVLETLNGTIDMFIQNCESIFNNYPNILEDKANFQKVLKILEKANKYINKIKGDKK